jgi:hypothetical protein
LPELSGKGGKNIFSQWMEKFVPTILAINKDLRHITPYPEPLIPLSLPQGVCSQSLRQVTSLRSPTTTETTWRVRRQNESGAINA